MGFTPVNLGAPPRRSSAPSIRAEAGDHRDHPPRAGEGSLGTHLALVRNLLDRGANPSLQDGVGRAAFFFVREMALMKELLARCGQRDADGGKKVFSKQGAEASAVAEKKRSGADDGAPDTELRKRFGADGAAGAGGGSSSDRALSASADVPARGEEDIWNRTLVTSHSPNVFDRDPALASVPAPSFKQESVDVFF